jgi:GntR family transcriptional regulator
MKVPAYLTILSELRARIAAGVWPVGERIPTDEALMQEFGVSRFTVRAALDVLVADGIVTRFRSRGSFVTARAEGAGGWLLTSLDDLVAGGFPTPPIVLDAAEGACPPAVARPLGLDDGAAALRIRVIRRTDGQPYSYSVIHVPQALAARLPGDWPAQSATSSFVGMIAAANGMAIHKAIQSAQAIAAPGCVADRLEVTPGTPLLLLERSFFSREGAPMEHARIYTRSDRYRQIVAFRSRAADDAPQPEGIGA